MFSPGDIVQIGNAFGIIVEAHASIDGRGPKWNEAMPKIDRHCWYPQYAVDRLPLHGELPKHSWYIAEDFTSAYLGLAHHHFN